MTAPRTGDDAGLREAVADAIKPLVDDTDASYPQVAEGAIRAVRSWDEANAGSVPVAGWAACSERMPELGKRVLCVDSRNWFHVMNFSRCDNPDDGYQWRGYGYSFNADDAESVTAWMPLPPAPGEAAAPVQVMPTCDDVFDVLLHNGYEINAHTVKDIENLFKTAVKPKENP